MSASAIVPGSRLFRAVQSGLLGETSLTLDTVRSEGCTHFCELLYFGWFWYKQFNSGRINIYSIFQMIPLAQLVELSLYWGSLEAQSDVEQLQAELSLVPSRQELP